MRYILAILVLLFFPPVLFGADECFDCHGRYKKTSHGRLDCTACHNDAKGLPHPGKLKKPDCAACHEGTVKRYGQSVHAEKNLACRQCHLVHNIGEGAGQCRVCARCHANVYTVYKGTAHAKGPQGPAATCTDCHDPHRAKAYEGPGPSERVAVCIRCHKDYKGKHAWLPHAELHFMHLECSACHSPRSEKGMLFTVRVRTEGRERNLSYDDVAAAFGTKKPARDLIDLNGDGRISSSEAVPFFNTLRSATPGTIAIDGSIVVTRAHHDYSAVQKRDRVCSTCHSDDAPFYQSMYLVLPERKGFSQMPVKGSVLASMPLSLAANFILLGETKLHWSDIKALLGSKGKARQEIIRDLGFRWIDIIGIFVCIAVLFFILVHIILRAVFRR